MYTAIAAAKEILDVYDLFFGNICNTMNFASVRNCCPFTGVGPISNLTSKFKCLNEMHTAFHMSSF